MSVPGTSVATGPDGPDRIADTPMDTDEVEEVVHTRQVESPVQVEDEAKERRIQHALKTLYPERFKEKRERDGGRAKRKRKRSSSPVYDTNKCSDCVKRYDDVVRRVHEELLSGRLTMAGVARIRKTRNKRVQTTQCNERQREDSVRREDSARREDNVRREDSARREGNSRARQPMPAFPHPLRCQCETCLNKRNSTHMKVMPGAITNRVYSFNAMPYTYEDSTPPSPPQRDIAPSGAIAPRGENTPSGNYPRAHPQIENSLPGNIARSNALIPTIPLRSAPEICFPSSQTLREQALINNAKRDNALINNALKSLTLRLSALNSMLGPSTDHQDKRRKRDDRRAHARCMTCEPTGHEAQPVRRLINRPEPIPYQAPRPNPRVCDDEGLKDLHQHVIEEDLRSPGLIYLDVLEDLHAQGPCRKYCQLRADVVWLRQRTHKTKASQTHLTKDSCSQTNFVTVSEIDQACQTKFSSDVGIQKGNYYARIMFSKAAGTDTISTQASMPDLPHLEKPVNHVVGIPKSVNRDTNH